MRPLTLLQELGKGPHVAIFPRCLRSKGPRVRVAPRAPISRGKPVIDFHIWELSTDLFFKYSLTTAMGGFSQLKSVNQLEKITDYKYYDTPCDNKYAYVAFWPFLIHVKKKSTKSRSLLNTFASSFTFTSEVIGRLSLISGDTCAVNMPHLFHTIPDLESCVHVTGASIFLLQSWPSSFCFPLLPWSETSIANPG